MRTRFFRRRNRDHTVAAEGVDELIDGRVVSTEKVATVEGARRQHEQLKRRDMCNNNAISILETYTPLA